MKHFLYLNTYYTLWIRYKKYFLELSTSTSSLNGEMVLVNSNSTKPSVFPSPPKLTLQENAVKLTRKRKSAFENNQSLFKIYNKFNFRHIRRYSNISKLSTKRWRRKWTTAIIASRFFFNSYFFLYKNFFFLKMTNKKEPK